MSVNREVAANGGDGRYGAVPQELREWPNWMCWKKGDPKPDGGYQKPPVSPHTGYVAAHNHPANRGTFEEAVAAVERFGLDGISFVPTPEDPLTLVDFDGCRDTRTGEITKPEVREWLEKADTYAEVSPSGSGIRVAAKGSIPRTINNSGVEMYSSGQQLTITGDRLPEFPSKVRESQAALTELFRRYASGESSGVGWDLKIDEAEPPVRLDEYGLEVWRGERPAVKDDGSGEISRSLTLYKIACKLAETGATARVIRAAIAERDVALGYRKYLDRPDERAEREYTRIALKATQETGTRPGRASSSSSPLVVHDNDDALVRPPLRVIDFADAPPVLNKRSYVVRDLIPARYPSALYAAGGSAKSLLAASLTQAIVRGDDEWMGFEIESSGPCLYIDFELDLDEQTRRARQIALEHNPEGGGSTPRGLGYLNAGDYLTGKVLQVGLDWCRENGAVMVVLDSMGYALEGDAEASRDVMAFFRNYVTPFQTAGIAVLIVDHQSKMQSGDNYHAKSAFGSVYKSNSVRSSIQVEPLDGSKDELIVRLRHHKVNFGPKFDPFDVRLRFNEMWVTLEKSVLDTTEVAQEGSLSIPGKVRRFLEDGPAYPDEIAETMEMPLGSIQNAITKLKKTGVVVATGKKDGNKVQVRLAADGPDGHGRESSSPHLYTDDDDDDSLDSPGVSSQGATR